MLLMQCFREDTSDARGLPMPTQPSARHPKAIKSYRKHSGLIIDNYTGRTAISLRVDSGPLSIEIEIWRMVVSNLPISTAR